MSAFFFAVMNLFVKLSGDLPSIQKSFFRNLVAAGVAAVILIRGGQGFGFQKKNLPLLLMYLSFAERRRTRISDTTNSSTTNTANIPLTPASS